MWIVDAQSADLAGWIVLIVNPFVVGSLLFLPTLACEFSRQTLLPVCRPAVIVYFGISPSLDFKKFARPRADFCHC